jgi:hypothetical protein
LLRGGVGSARGEAAQDGGPFHVRKVAGGPPGQPGPYEFEVGLIFDGSPGPRTPPRWVLVCLVRHISAWRTGTAVPKLIPANPPATAHPPTGREIRAQEQKYPTVDDGQTARFLAAVSSPAGTGPVTAV